jgi:hypothetical protein
MFLRLKECLELKKQAEIELAEFIEDTVVNIVEETDGL